MKFNLNNPAFLQMAGNAQAKDYFYITSLADGNELTFSTCLMGIFADNIEYSLHSQEDWEQLTADTVINLDEQETVYFRNYTGVVNTADGSQLLGVTDKFNAGGNIVHLFYPGKSKVPDTGLSSFFSGLPIVSAENLNLSAKKLGVAAYAMMFANCTNLITPPVLPATILSERCYDAMFERCSSLAFAPELPAVNLAYQCYLSMFVDCYSLTATPVLPATILSERCYESMFSGCEELQQITCLAENISADACTEDWLTGVPKSGKFIKAANMEDWSDGANGIPAGWTVEDYVG